jgi:hypothetical protein
MYCLGYYPDYHIGNWIGNLGLENYWRDSTHYTTFLDNVNETVLIPSLNSGMSFNDDYEINSDKTDTQNVPKIVIADGTALVVWQSNHSGSYQIMGKFIDLNTYPPVFGDDFLISQSIDGNKRYPQVGLYGRKAFVVWQSNEFDWADLFGNFVDFDGNPPVSGGDLWLNENIDNNYQEHPQIAVSDDGIALIVWDSDHIEGWGDYDIMGRFVDFNSEQALDSEFAISTTNNLTQYAAKIGINGYKALVVWVSFHSDNGNVMGRFVDFYPDDPVPDNEFHVATFTANRQGSIEIGTANDRALAVWQSSHSDSGDIMGRFFDFETKQPLPGNEFEVSLTNTDTQGYPSVKIENAKAYIVWNSSGSGIMGRVIGFVDNPPDPVGEFNISNSELSYDAEIVMSDNKALVVWSAPNAGGFDIMGKFVDFHTGQSFPGDDFTISAFNDKYQSSPGVVLADDNAFVVWSSTHDASIDLDNWEIMGQLVPFNAYFKIDYTENNYGLNNFFVAPLIERNYKVKVNLSY